MSQAWPDYAVERTIKAFEGKRYVSRNGKVFFKKVDRERGFIYEAEVTKFQYRMHPIKKSHTFVEYESLDEMLKSGWVIE